MDIVIEEAQNRDLPALLALYKHLHPYDPDLTVDQDLRTRWYSILSNPTYYYAVARDGDDLISTCALTIVPNLTRGGRPCGLIENVVTHPDWRCRGIGTAVIRHTLEVAWEARCYKVMLLTGRSDESTLRFYEKAGFLRGVKTGFVAKPPQ